MVRLYIKKLKSIWMILYIISIIYFYVINRNTVSVNELDMIHRIIYSHFMTLSSTMFFLLASYERTKVVLDNKNNIMVRLKEEDFIFKLVKIAIVNVLLYTLISYIIPYVFFTKLYNANFINLYAYFITYSAILMLLYEFIYIYSLFFSNHGKKQKVMMILPFFINVIMHYTIQASIF